MVSVEDQIDHLLDNNNDVIVVPVVKSAGKGLFGFLRQFWYGALIGMLIVTLTLLVPIYNGKTGLDVLQEFFESNGEGDVVSVGEEIPPEPEAYHYWYALPDSFGVSEMKTVNWTHFQALFNEHFYKKAIYKRYSYSEWTNGTEYLTLNKTWNESGFWKVDIMLDVPVDLYSVNISFGCDLPVLDYVEREGYEIWLNYTANATETYNIFFNWSDIADIPNLKISKHRQDGKFWISFKRDNVPAGHYKFDPIFGWQETTQDTFLDLRNYIVCTFATMGATGGTADNIIANLWVTTSAHRAKCAIYDSSFDLIANGATDEVSVPVQAYTWTTFTFSTSPSLVADADYYLAVWGEDGAGIRVGLDNDDNVIKRDDVGYTGTFPSSMPVGVWDWESTSYTAQIYCTYTEGVANNAPTVEVYSPDNASTGHNLSGYCRIFANDSDAGDKVNITWRTNESNGYITIADNNTQDPGSFDLYFPDFDGEDSQYWWEIFCDDGTDNVSKRFWFETALNMTERIISQDINGSYTSLIDEIIVDTSVNGSYTCLIGQIIVDQTVNGSYTTLIIQTILDQTINGSYKVSPIEVKIIDQSINGSYVVQAISEKIVSQTINGSYTTLNIEYIVSQDINGSYTTLNVEYIIDQTINGSYQVTSISETIIDQTINGSYVVTSISERIISQDINGSYTTPIPEQIISQDINGSYVVISIVEQIISTDINGSYKVDMIVETIIDQTISGSYNTILLIYNITITNPYPANGSVNIQINTSLYFTVNNTLGYTMNITVYTGSNLTNCSALLGSFNSVNNGTYYLGYHNASEVSTEYAWRVNVTDAYDNYAEEIYNFTTASTTGDIYVMGGGGYGMGMVMAFSMLFGMLFFILGGMMFVRRRKQNARRPPNSLNRYRY